MDAENQTFDLKTLSLLLQTKITNCPNIQWHFVFAPYSFILLGTKCQGAVLKRAKGSILAFASSVNAFF
jgi:hypothetical protein